MTFLLNRLPGAFQCSRAPPGTWPEPSFSIFLGSHSPGEGNDGGVPHKIPPKVRLAFILAVTPPLTPLVRPHRPRDRKGTP